MCCSEGDNPLKVDAHQHFWTIERKDYGWLTPARGIMYADYLPEHFQAYLEKYQWDRTIVVQAAPTLEETEYLLGLYDQHEFIAGVVGWLELDCPQQQFKEQYDRLKEHPGFIGFRPMIQDLIDPWIMRPRVMRNLAVVERDSFPIDLQLRPRLLPYMLQAMEQLPGLRAVVDHAAKPFVAERVIEPWKEHMMQLASYPNVFCKVSGLVREADQLHWKWEDLVPYVSVLVGAFGQERLMFGSDWPVCLETASYEATYEAIQKAMPGSMSEAELASFYGENALRFYSIGKSGRGRER
jgi:L-fuconolactonase